MTVTDPAPAATDEPPAIPVDVAPPSAGDKPPDLGARRRGPAVCEECGESRPTGRGLANYARSCQVGSCPIRKGPPKTKKKSRRAAGAKRPPRPDLAEKLETAISSIGLAVSLVDATDGQIIARGAPRIAKAAADLAATNPAVYDVLDKLLSTSDWGALVVAVGSVAVPIVLHHSPALRARLGLMGEMLIAEAAGQPLTPPTADPPPPA